MEPTKSMQQLEQLLQVNLTQSSVEEIINTIKNFYVFLCYENEADLIVVSFVNKLLHASEYVAEGFKLLNMIILKIPVQFILDHYLLWFPLCLCLGNNDPLNHIKFELLVKIIQSCSGTEDFDKFLVDNLQKLIVLCLSAQSTPTIIEHALNCINICIEKYPSACIPSKSDLEQSFAKYITSDQPKSVIKHVGSAFHLLQQVGQADINSNNRKSNWSTQFNKLCITVHKIYNDFFENVPEYIITDLFIAPFPITDIESSGYSSIKKQIERATVLRNLVIFINQMLLEKYSYPKTVLVYLILDVFNRGLIVDVYDDCEDSIEQTHFSILLYDHQIELLYLLRSLIACLKQNLLPVSITISKIIIDCLQRMQKQFFKNSCAYQAAVYKVLSYWISTIHNNLDSGTHNKIVSAILIDITPEFINDVVTVDQVRRKHLTDIMTNQLPSARESISQDFLRINEKKCIYALESCINLLENINLQLDETNFNALFKTVTTNILSVQANKTDHPYKNANCVVLLYKVLHALFNQPSYCVTPMISIAIKLFTNGQNLSCNNDVRMICNNSLHTLEKLCQPICPSLSIPIVCERLSNINQRAGEDQQLFKEIQNGDKPIPPATPKSPPKTDLLPQLVSPNKRVNILDICIIKPASATNKAEPEATPPVVTHTETQNNEKNQNKLVSEKIKLSLDKSMQTEDVNGTDVPPNKQMKIAADHDKEELMLTLLKDSKID